MNTNPNPPKFETTPVKKSIEQLTEEAKILLAQKQAEILATENLLAIQEEIKGAIAKLAEVSAKVGLLPEAFNSVDKTPPSTAKVLRVKPEYTLITNTTAKATLVDVDSYDWSVLSTKVPLNEKLTMEELCVLGQYHKGGYPTLITKGYPHAPIDAETLLSHMNAYEHNHSPIPIIFNDFDTTCFTRIHSSIVCEILQITIDSFKKLFFSNTLKGMHHSGNNFYVFGKDLENYIKAKHKGEKPEVFLQYLKVIPNMFPRAVYLALATNQDFTKLQRNCIFGFNLITSDYEKQYPNVKYKKWYKADELLANFDNSITSFFKGKITGVSSVRSWFSWAYPEILSGQIEHHKNYPKNGYLDFLSIFGNYLGMGKDSGKLSFRFNPENNIKKEFSTATYQKAGDIAFACNTGSPTINKLLISEKYQIKSNLDVNSKGQKLIPYIPTAKALSDGVIDPESFAYANTEGALSRSLLWKADILVPLFKTKLSK